MNEIFKSGQKVRLESSGQTCEIASFIGGGGQGEVYRVRLGSREFALKWYFPAAATVEQRHALELLVRKGPPTEHFLWPIEMASQKEIAGFGYLMPLRDERFCGIVDLMNRSVDPSFRTLVHTGLELVSNFLQLHSNGFCYCDISFGNVFFDPQNGQVLICDNDNVGVDGENYAGVLGTPSFMAPEVVVGHAKPSIQTDLYSLAILLFYIFFTHHPLNGRRESDIKCLDLPAMKRLYGTEALFIFDPDDDSNAPVPGLHDNALTFWPLYPIFFREIFTRAFTGGLVDAKHGRVRESEWRAALLRMLDVLYYCPACGAEQFLDEPADAFEPLPAHQCWACQADLPAPPRLRVGRHGIVLNQSTRIYVHHIDATRRNDFSQTIAELVPHPTRPDVWGLKNMSQTAWTSTNPAGSVLEVPPGRSVSIVPGTKIYFGLAEGMII